MRIDVKCAKRKIRILENMRVNAVAAAATGPAPALAATSALAASAANAALAAICKPFMSDVRAAYPADSLHLGAPLPRGPGFQISRP